MILQFPRLFMNYTKCPWYIIGHFVHIVYNIPCIRLHYTFHGFWYYLSFCFLEILYTCDSIDATNFVYEYTLYTITDKVIIYRFPFLITLKVYYTHTGSTESIGVYERDFQLFVRFEP